jgi:hypothetical protein
VRSFVGAVPLSALAVVVALFAAILLSRAVADRLHTRRSIAFLLLFGFGFVMAATLVPDAAAFDGVIGDAVCDVSRVGFAPFEDLVERRGAGLNVVLLVPLGIAVGLLPQRRVSVVIAIAAISLPFMVEATQLVVTALGRGCQTADVFDNLMGLAIGIAIGMLARPLISRVPAMPW